MTEVRDADATAAVTLETLTAAFLQALGAEGPPDRAQSVFLDRVAEDYRADELPNLSAADLAVALADFWRFAAQAGAGRAAIRIVSALGADGRPLGVDRLEISQPDAPFLVDSVMGAITDSGAEVRAMFHPVAPSPQGGDRSLIQVWLSPVPEDRRAALISEVEAALDEVHAAVEDFPAMLGLLARTTAELQRAAPGDPADLSESLAFLRWIESGHFVLLGARIYDYPLTADGDYAAEEPDFQPDHSLGVLRDPERSILRRSDEPAVLSGDKARREAITQPLVVAKANLRSRVHRRVNMDYFAVRRYGPDGRPVGETRFCGLFTAHAYQQLAREMPLLRRKVAQVMDAAGFPPVSHNATRLANLLETYPRDELFQVSPSELLPMALGVLHLSDRPRFKLFVRRDAFGRFLSILFYAPRDRYDARLRRLAGEILARAFGGRVTASYPTFGDNPLARVHYILQLQGPLLDPDLTALEGEIARAARTWRDDFEVELRARLTGPGEAAAALAVYGRAFPAGYRERESAAEAVRDMRVIDTLVDEGQLRVRAFREAGDDVRRFRFKLYHRGEAPPPLARILPILDHMGLDALAEEGFEITPRRGEAGAAKVWIHAFVVEDPHGERLDFDRVRGPFESAFMAVWRGEAEDDGFNRLIMELGADWREAALIRALARYRGQSGLDPSQPVQEAALAAYPQVASLLLRLFAVRFDPATGEDLETRAAAAGALGDEINAALMAVESLDHDRVLRRLAALIHAVTRTSFYQRDAQGRPHSHISFKVASRELADLPAPKPHREIFVASPQVEGVHLRFGPVARGGLRWSDRRDDFRTEVLGLVKAQQVKNAVIVPVGSKGGFYPKQLPRGAAPAAVREAAVAAYRTFLRGLLDITDNLDPEGRVIHPAGVVVHDGEDPYLVVAADKGTATFSDIANGVAADYGFWLGDAFASGGSAGYDHKAMGITARGAWESVKRHFRELGKDIQKEPFTVVGVGDMSGDVFGNGMLLSRCIRLRAAFDHRHLFVDPDPDPEASWIERKRLFDLPASSWDDYDKRLISAGGGVWPRSAKSIPVSEAMRALLDIKGESASPAELISAILRSRTELLYFGGIGTYVKAAGETHAQAGDKANDPIRVDARELRCRVVGEGANLGVTQAGRIEFALAGGRINTDAIDNSAGVDTSDHEVNIKILTGMAERGGVLAPQNRNALLASMTDDIAAHVLKDNYDQTLQLSLQEAEGTAEADAQERYMQSLEASGRLDRALEGLPASAALAERVRGGRGLTRPERAVLLAYSKLELFDDLIASPAPDDPAFEALLHGYFPPALGAFDALMSRHRLRREIVATVLANDMVNLCGPTFASRLRAGAGCDAEALAVSFAAARACLRLDEDWRRVCDLDGQAPAAGQLALYAELARILRGQTYWFARRAARDRMPVARMVARYQPAVEALRELIPGVLSSFERKAAVRRSAAWIKAGAPKALAHAFGLMRPLTYAADLADLAQRTGWSLAGAAHVYHRVGGQFGFDRLRSAAAELSVGDVYERMAVRRLIEDILAEQSDLAAAVMAGGGDCAQSGEALEKHAAAAISAWTGPRARVSRAVRERVEAIEASPGGWTFAKLTIANTALRELAAG